MPWVAEIVGWVDSKGYLFCTEHAEEHHKVTPKLADSFPVDCCDSVKCDRALGGERGVQTFVEVDARCISPERDWTKPAKVRGRPGWDV